MKANVNININGIKLGIFFVVLMVAAWQDFRTRSVDQRLFLIFGGIGLSFRLLEGSLWPDMVSSCAVGGLLLGLSLISGGGIGDGDGWFFVVSGMYLHWTENLFLFLSGLFLCFAWSVPLAIKAVIQNGRGRKRGLPFLPFLLPGGIWIAVL